MKRVWIIGLALLLAVCMAGCGGKKELTDADLTIPSREETTRPPKETRTTEETTVPASETEEDTEETNAPIPGASKEEVKAAADFVKSEEAIDGMRPGIYTSDVRSRLGEEDDFPAIEMEVMYLFYFSYGYTFRYLRSSGLVTEISAFSPAEGKTTRGIRIGDPLEKVLKAYGDGINADLSTDEILVFGNDNAALRFSIEEDVVSLISLSY